MNKFALLLTTGFVLIAGCATRPGSVLPTNQNGQSGSPFVGQIGDNLSKELDVAVINSERQTVRITYSGPELVANFPLIPGSLGGAPSTKPMKVIPAEFGRSISFPLGEVARLIDPFR